jgi:hypothetical protein
MLAKYVHQLFNQQDKPSQKSGISTDLLRQNGFM